MNKPVLYIIIPCYNEQEVLPVTAPMFLDKLTQLIESGRISDDSRIMFVNDGSADDTWSIITRLASLDAHYIGISQSRNRGHQNALWAGLMESKAHCDITITVDCDGQDDINAMDAMVDEYLGGSEIVYGVRSDRDTDSAFKRKTAQGFYKILAVLGAEVVYDHADYRLLSRRVIDELEKFDEVNLYLRGMIPLVGFKSSCVGYSRRERIAGESKYPLRKMLGLEADGVTSLSIKPLRLIAGFGIVVAALSFIGVVWAIVTALCGNTVAGWASTTCIVCFMGGVQLICLGIIGEYVGKIYLESKHRPKYIISERTGE